MTPAENSPAPAADSVLDIGSRLELFVDDHLIDTLQNARLEMHPPTRREVSIEFDEPWEGKGSFYPTVLKDGDTYRAYYRGKPMELEDGAPDEDTCYAESADGIHWTKPNLGLFEARGRGDNNVILSGEAIAPIPHNFTPFIDARPGTPTAERLKGLGGLINWCDDDGTPRHAGVHGLMGFISADGIRWTPVQDEPVMDRDVHPLSTDTAQSCAFWSQMEEQYVCYTRMWYDDGAGVDKLFRGNIRWIGRTTSPDFIHWSRAELVSFGDAPPEHLYTNQIQPYFRAPHIYLGLPYRFLPDRQIAADHPASGISDGVLISSRDGVNWDRTFLESYLRPGRDRRNWTDRNICIACGVVPTADDELSLYWIENYRHDTCRLRRGTVRMDGFASVRGPYTGGEVVTRPLQFDGSELVLNYATSAAGSVAVELQDADGSPLSSFALADCEVMIGDEIEAVVRWRDGADVSSLAGRPVRLRLVLRDADVYAFRFAPVS